MQYVVSCLAPGTVLDRGVQGLLSEGRRWATQLQLEHVVVLSVADGDALAAHCAQQADFVLAVQDDAYQAYQPESCLAVLQAACNRFPPALVLFGQDTYGQESGPRLAFRLNGSSAGDAQQIEYVDGKFRVVRSVYGDKAVATIQLDAAPAVICLRARAYAVDPPRPTPGSIEACSLISEVPDDRVRITERQSESSGGVRLEDAQVIVSGGRGLGGPEPFAQLHQLAEAINAQVAASRAACDSGWVPPGLQVGQTGKKVAPELYLAIAISGASQHLMGIADAKVVAAINTDADAPIFRRCQFGLVEDWKVVVPALTERLRVMQKSQA